MNGIYNWYKVSKKKQEYRQRKEMVELEIKNMEDELKLLMSELKNLTETYGVFDEIKLVRIKTDHVFVIAWQFKMMTTTYKVNKRQTVYEQEFPLRVRNLFRLSDEQKKILADFLQSKDDVFIHEIINIEKKRLAINATVSALSKVQKYLDNIMTKDNLLENYLL